MYYSNIPEAWNRFKDRMQQFVGGQVYVPLGSKLSDGEFIEINLNLEKPRGILLLSMHSGD